MNVIVTKELIDVRYTLGGVETVKSRYSQLKGTFPEGKEYRIFAEPVLHEGTKKISWTTEYNGTILNYNQLNPEQQSKVRDMLSTQVKYLINAAKKYEDDKLIDFLYKCIEIPDMEDVFIVRTDQGDKVVLIEWGFVSDTPGGEKGLLLKIVNAKRVPMVFSVVYDDDEKPAVGVEVHFEYEDKKEIYTSDQQGQITLESVKVEGFVKAYEMEGDEPINIQTFTCIEYGNYLIKVTRKAEMRFKVVNQHDEPQQGISFDFEFSNQKTQLSSDQNGVIVLPEVRVGTEVKVSRTINGLEKDVHRFIQKIDTENIIRIETEEAPPPPVYKMRIKVVDKKDNPIPNAQVTVTYAGQTKQMITDDKGYIEIEDIEPGTKVKVKAKAKKPKKK